MEKCIEMQIFRQVENQGWSACLLACRRRELGSGRYSIIIKVGTYYSVRKEVGMNAENFLSNVTTLPFNSKAVQRFMMTSVLNI